MTFKTQLTADVSNVFFNTDEFAVTGTYNSADGSIVSSSVTALIDYLTDLGSTDFGAADIVELMFKASEVADPKVYDTFTSGGVVYTIRQRLVADADTVKVAAEADQRQKPGNL